MNDLEQRLYTKGLENLYGSVLLGEERALNYIENMVYLTREFTASAASRRPLEEEVLFIRSFCAVCWPDVQINVQLEGDMSGCQMIRKSLSGPVCRDFLDFERHGRIPGLLVLWQEEGHIHYRLEGNGRTWTHGVIHDE